jgi:hypothetical protein
MGMDMLQQTSVFVFAAIFGVLAALVFDLFSVTARLFRRKKAAIWIFDGIYCVLCFVGAVLFLLIEGTGQIESYILFGAVLGAVVYFFTVSALFKHIFRTKRVIKYRK